MYHVPMCVMCGEYEVGTFEGGDTTYCSGMCADKAYDYITDGEPEGSHDLSDDADALASAGWGTDEDYNHYDYGEDY
jgi:hypothetical protein